MLLFSPYRKNHDFGFSNIHLHPKFLKKSILSPMPFLYQNKIISIQKKLHHIPFQVNTPPTPSVLSNEASILLIY